MLPFVLRPLDCFLRFQYLLSPQMFGFFPRLKVSGTKKNPPGLPEEKIFRFPFSDFSPPPIILPFQLQKRVFTKFTFSPRFCSQSSKEETVLWLVKVNSSPNTSPFKKSFTRLRRAFSNSPRSFKRMRCGHEKYFMIRTCLPRFSCDPLRRSLSS